VAPPGEGPQAEREDHHHSWPGHLRGQVNSAKRKRLIGEITDRIARSENVDNQLELKFTASSND